MRPLFASGSRAALVLALGFAFASSPGHADADGDRVTSAKAAADRQRELNHEYAKLYKAVSGLRFMDELLLLKFESDETEQLVGQVAAFGARAKSELEDLDRAHAEVSLEEDGRSELSRESSKRQRRDRRKTYAPLTGVSGPDFERMLLLGQSSTLYQLRFRADVMADAETSQARRDYLRKMRGDLDRLYVQTVRLLDQKYFRPPAKTPLGAIGGDD